MIEGERHLAVLGMPISHSRSPAIHRAIYAQLGLPWSYAAIVCAESELAGLLDGSTEAWLGYSVTMPLKARAAALSTWLDPVARESGVVNTLLRLPCGERFARQHGWAGFNTDVPGLTAALLRANVPLAHTVVLGAGATAVSAVLAARSCGAARVTLLARHRASAVAVQQRFGDTLPIAVADLAAEAVPADASAVISTLPGSAKLAEQLPAALCHIPLFDVAYDPWPSPLAAYWRARGGIAHSGISMLVEQALVQVRIFSSGDPARALPGEEQLRKIAHAAALSVER